MTPAQRDAGVEKMAREMYERRLSDFAALHPKRPWETLPSASLNNYRNLATAALAAWEAHEREGHAAQGEG